ncbi:MAG: hypothetical protein ACE366_31300 [Bradymonadia bacterium]
MGHTIDFFALPPGQIAKVRHAEGLEGLQRRLKEHGQMLTSLSLECEPVKAFKALEKLLETPLVCLLGAEVGPLDGRKTDPKAGLMGADDVSDTVDCFEGLSEALHIDLEEADEDDDSELFDLRSLAEETADGIDMAFDDFETFVDELFETLKVALDKERAVVTLVSSA